MSQDILTSLRELREKLQDRLLDLPEYRALSAIEKAISDVTEMLEATVPARTYLASVTPPPTLTPVPESRAEASAQAIATAPTSAVARRIDVARYFPRHHVG